MLRDHLSSFLCSIPSIHPDSEKEVVRAILLYVMGVPISDAAGHIHRNTDYLRALSRHVGLTEEVYEFKSSYLDRSYYTISQFWRLAYEYFKRLKVEDNVPVSIKVDEAAVKEAVRAVSTIDTTKRSECAADLRLIEEFLSLEDHQRLYRIARTKLSVYPTPTDIDLKPIVEKLRRYCWKIAYHKARFIPQNDTGVTIDDIAIEMFEVGLRVIREYDSDWNGLKILNTSKVGARNHCNRLIDYYTAQKRSRVVRLADGEYQATTISLNHELPSERYNGSTATILDTIEDDTEMQDTRYEQERWLTDLICANSPDIGRVIAITLGNDDPEFDIWVERRTGKAPTDIPETSLARYACEFIKVPLADVREALLQNETIAETVATGQQKLAYA